MPYFPPNVSPPYAVILVVSVKITTFAKFSFIIATLCVLSGNLVKRIEVCTKYALVLIPFSRRLNVWISTLNTLLNFLF